MEALLVSGASDGLLILWSADHGQDSRELVPKLSLKAHDGGVVAVELSRVIGGAPQLITIGADKTLAIWDTISFKPHLVATGTNIGIIVSEFDARSLPPVVPLPTPPGSREHSAVYIVERELKLLNFQLSNTANPSLGNNGSLSETARLKGDSFEPLLVKQIKKHISTPVPHDSYSVLSVSSSGKTSRRISPGAATAISTIQSMPLSGFGGSSSFSTFDDGFSSQRSPAEALPQNFQLFSWETFQPVGGLLPQPEWTAWDQTVEYCAFAYQHYIVISSLRPQYRYLGDVAIAYATGALHDNKGVDKQITDSAMHGLCAAIFRCVFVDAGVAPIDVETRKKKEEMKLKEAQARAVAEHGELALITVDGPQTATQERIALRLPMLQVVRLASFQHAPSVPPFLSLPKQSKLDGDDATILKEMEERKVNEIAVGGGGVSVAVTRFPTEQKRPVGPLIVVGVRDGVLWLIDRYMTAHALSLSHPGIRCRCLAAYGDAVSAVKWASRLGREHHDDLAQFMLGMGYATEALHLPGISKRLEFDLAMKSNDLKRALQCLLTMSNSRDIGQDNPGLDLNDILNVTAKKENLVEAVQGIVKFAKEFLDLIDAADATAQADIAREALKRLATAGSVKGALQVHELRGLALRLANHGELTRLSGLVNNLISLGLGREAAFSAAVLGDNALMEKAWQDTGMLAEAVLHAHAHGRPTLKNLVEAWNRMLQKEVEHTPSGKTDATAAFLASLEEPKLTSLSEAGKKPPIEILPPGMSALSASINIKKKPAPMTQTSQQQPSKPLALEGPSPSGPAEAPIGVAPPTGAGEATVGAPSNGSAAAPGTPIGAPPSSVPVAAPGTPIGAPPPAPSDAASIGVPSTSNSSEPASDDKAPNLSSGRNPEMIASAENNPATSTSDTPAPDTTLADKPTAEAPTVKPDNQETNVLTALPTSEPLA
ncbi:hypothetical protein COLO4_07112 [Corchorus olitorius]|uniref:Uncharacterized protein n=1 Tax=Corchorus olitorius TaxID=93759 RepID=A0A1R3KKU9_9ROSI|nr:hypothetical protein COLO4_07112 [Corchorus olitorius]